MRILFGSFIQETNTFCPVACDIDIFKRGYIWEGDQIAEKLAGTNTEVSGFFNFFADKDAILVPSIACWAVAAGKITKSAYEKISDRFCSALKAAMPIDGICLALHGAMASESEDDCEGRLLERMRDIVGANIPISVSLDYHANITKKMVNSADVMVGFRTYPHVDFEETGYKAADALYKMITTGIHPQKVFCKLPLMVPVEDAETDSGVCGEVIGRLKAFDTTNELLASSLFCAQPWLDIAEVGVSLLFYVCDPQRRAYWQAQADGLGKFIMDNKTAFFADYPSIDQALANLNGEKKPVILVDSGDITTAGGIGDSTVSLRAMLGKNYRAALIIVSPKAVAQAFAVGEGNYGEIVIGGETDYGYNSDVTVHAMVVKLNREPSQIKGKSFSGIMANSGGRAYLRVGENLHIVVAEFATLMYDPQFLRDMGVEPHDMDVIVQKSHKLFRAAYKDIASSIVIMDTPGFSDKNLSRLKFARVTRPIYPLDEIRDIYAVNQ